MVLLEDATCREKEQKEPSMKDQDRDACSEAPGRAGRPRPEAPS